MKHKGSSRQTEKAATEKTAAVPGQQSVQDRAYALYLKRGQVPGHEMEDWLQAEREIVGQHDAHPQH